MLCWLFKNGCCVGSKNIVASIREQLLVSISGAAPSLRRGGMSVRCGDAVVEERVGDGTGRVQSGLPHMSKYAPLN